MHMLTQVLQEFPQIRSEINNLSERLANNSLIQGLFLDVNPFWWHGFQLANAGLDPNRNEVWWYYTAQDHPIAQVLGEDVSSPASQDFYEQYAISTSLTEQVFGKRDYNGSPFLLKIISKPSSQGDGRAELLQVARSSSIPTLVQTRSVARFIAKPGDPLTSPYSSSGTLGGFLRDRHSRTSYATTCGHVLGVGTPTAAAGSALGSCRYSLPPVIMPPGTRCHAQCPLLARQDLALVEIGNMPIANQCKQVAAYVYSHQLVEMTGATSGLVQYEVGGTGMNHEVGGACWQGVFELRQRASSGVLHPKITQLWAAPPKDGDSGAWVTAGTEWCGIVVAADNSTGYALPSDQVLAEAQSSWGLTLELA